MKKIFINLALAAILSLPLTALAADADAPLNQSPVDVFTGEIWQQTSPDNKKAWLFGIDTVVDVEKAINEKMAAPKRGKKPPVSPFVKNWISALDNVKRTDIIDTVDQWYAAHPDQLKRPVLDTIWYEIIVPATKAK